MSTSKQTRVGLIGCGNISNAYIKGGQIFKNLAVTACSDIREEAARAKAEEHGLTFRTVDDLLKDEDIDIVVNLTIPAAHAEVSARVLEAGKHVHSEKPLAIDREDARKLLELAARKGLRVGCAPDTFLGAGLQTCRKVLDDGWIGSVLAGSAFMAGRGPEGWHPNPAFFYERGGGPMLDMGPYYVTALVSLLGPVKAISAVTRASFPERTIGSGQFIGRKLPVHVPTHYTGILEFHGGAVVTMIVSFDIFGGANLPCIELYGSQGSLSVPDPNSFAGDVRVHRPELSGWQSTPYVSPYSENSRIIGVADMADAIAGKRPHRCSGELAFHVLDVMMSFEDASREGRRIELKSTCAQPAALPTGLIKGLLA